MSDVVAIVARDEELKLVLVDKLDLAQGQQVLVLETKRGRVLVATELEDDEHETVFSLLAARLGTDAVADLLG